MRGLDVDHLAAKLAEMGQMARALPPAWDGALVAHHVRLEDGTGIARMLPGRGVYVDLDLKLLGITKPIPLVYERSGVMRWLERHIDPRKALLLAKMGQYLRDESGLLKVYDHVIASRGTGTANDAFFVKIGPVSAGATNAWQSVHQLTGMPGVYTFVNVPGGEAPTRATAGALSIGLFNPGSAKKYLLAFGVFHRGSSGDGGWFLLADMLVAAGNFNGNPTGGSQTINTTAITRNYTPQYGATPGPGVLVAVEVVTTGAGVTSSVVLTYTDQDGNGSSSMPSFQTQAGDAQQKGDIVPKRTYTGWGGFGPNLAAGDFGVRSVESALWTSPSGTNTMALLLIYPICWIPIAVQSVQRLNERVMHHSVDGFFELAKDGSNVLGFLTMFKLFPPVSSNDNTMGYFRTVKS